MWHHSQDLCQQNYYWFLLVINLSTAFLIKIIIVHSRILSASFLKVLFNSQIGKNLFSLILSSLVDLYNINIYYVYKHLHILCKVL